MAETNQVGGDFRQQPATFDNPAEQYFSMVLFIIMFIMEVVLTFWVCRWNLTIQMKDTDQDYSGMGSIHVYTTVNYYAEQGGFNIEVIIGA